MRCLPVAPGPSPPHPGPVRSLPLSHEEDCLNVGAECDRGVGTQGWEEQEEIRKKRVSEERRKRGSSPHTRRVQ